MLEFVWGLPIGLVFCLQLVTPKGLSRDSDFVIKQRIYVTLTFTSVVYAIYYFYYSKYHTPKLYEKELNDIDTGNLSFRALLTRQSMTVEHNAIILYF